MVKRYTRCHTRFIDGGECVRENPCYIHDPEGFAAESFSRREWYMLIAFAVFFWVVVGLAFMKFQGKELF